ncbi:MAG: HAMP domain-containing sensor histidine kinase [Actinomycetota bacterium]
MSGSLVVVTLVGAVTPWETRSIAILVCEVVLVVGLALACLRARREAVRWAVFIGRRQTTFDLTPVALWEEDFSAVASWLKTLPESNSPSSLRAFLGANPEALDHGISLIRVLSVNPAAARMIDLGQGKALFGGDPADPITAEVRTAVIEQLVTITQGQTELEVGISGSTRSGRVIDAILRWQAAGGGPGDADYSRVMVAIADISERVATERRLQGVVQSKDQLIASISHELRTPLTSVLGYAELLQASASDLSPLEQREMLALVASAAHDLNFIVEDLLTAARHQSKALTVGCVPVAVGAEAAQVVAQVRPADGRSVAVDTGSAMALGDPARVRQILRNLLVNALRYGGERIRISVAEDGPIVRVGVADDGDGVPPGDEQRIFDTYQRVQNRPEQPGSIGLGLGISRDLARLMGGDLAYRRHNAQTVFELTLPAADGHRRGPVSGAVPKPDPEARLIAV